MTEKEFIDAYRKGYQDAKAERDYDPGNAMPDDIEP